MAQGALFGITVIADDAYVSHVIEASYLRFSLDESLNPEIITVCCGNGEADEPCALLQNWVQSGASSVLTRRTLSVVVRLLVVLPTY